METYGVCLDDAMAGAFGAPFVAALAAQLPQGCRWRVSYVPDAWWDGDRLLQAAIVNGLRGLIWGLSDKKKRGPAPRQVGPDWATGRSRRTLPARKMPSAELVRRLSLPRKGGRP